MAAAVNKATIITMHSPAISSGVQAPPCVVADSTRPGMTRPTNKPPDITRAAWFRIAPKASFGTLSSGGLY